MSKTKAISLLLFLFFISLVFALEWRLIIEAVDKAYKTVGLKTPSYILTIIEKESGFGENLGYNLGSKEENLKRCINMCYWTEEKNKLDGKKLVYCFDKKRQEYTIEARTQWCNNQYSALEKIASNLGLDINKVPFSPDFGIGYAQFQPTTWLQYKELRNKNPWDLEDSLYAAALKLKYDRINENEERAIGEYNRNPKYYRDYLDKRQEWDQILEDTIFVYDCSSNNFSCALSAIKTNYSECTENDWPIKKKKECIKTKVAFQKEQKLAQKQNEAKTLVYEIQILETKESTPPYIEKAQNLLSSLIDLFTRKQISSVNNQGNQINSQKISLNEQNIRQTNQQTKINEQKQEEKITYKEENKEIIIERKIKENINTSTISLNLNNISVLQVPTLTITSTPTNTSTSATTTILTLRQQKIPTSTQIFSQTSYIGGGGVVTIQKDKCDDYKNKNYPKIIINEIQFETASDTKDEFIELYNPNNEEIDLTCWKLEKYASKQNSTSTPTLTTLIPPSKFQGKIRPNGYFLITSSSTKEKYQGDLSYAESYSISKNNVIILRKPNGEISDLVGYGDDTQKIYQYENSSFVAQNFKNKSIQRKNFQDTDDNSKDFWLHKPSPKNSSMTELPRQDFIDLTTITIQNFNVMSTSTEDGYFLNISFQEPTSTQTHADLTQTMQTNNYSYELLISTSTNFSTFKLDDFGATSTLPSSKFDGSTTSLSFEITKCPTTATTYYFALFLKDNLDEENKSNLVISSTTLPEDLCNPGEPILVQNIFTTTTSTGKILFSEIYIKEGTSAGEFIELYNPNEFNIDLTGWEIIKINRNGEEQKIVPSSKFKGIIPSFSYFLLVNANTSSEIITNPDFIYPKSYYLAKNNALILIDKEGKVIDKVCWGDIPNANFQNCIPNPTTASLSLQRKKTVTSTPETIINQNLGNAYSTNNSSNDFLYALINPENSSITRPTIKDIQNFQVTLGKPIITYKDYSYGNDGVLRGPGGACSTCLVYYDGLSGLSYDLKFKWFSPIVYDKENLRYELRFTSSSEVSFQDSLLLTTSTISFLDEQELSFNVYEFYKQTNNLLPVSTIIYLALSDGNNNLLKLASTTLDISLPQYNNRLEIPKDNVEYLTEPGYQQIYTQIKFTPRYDSEVKYISLETAYPEYIPESTLNLYDDQENLITTSTIKISKYLYSHWACSLQNFYLVELEKPFVLEKNKIYIIKTSNPSLRFQEFCAGYGVRLEGHMF
jgi:hypothetical protein